MKICLPEEVIETTYGVMGFGFEQSLKKTKELFENLNLICVLETENENNFYLKFIK